VWPRYVRIEFAPALLSLLLPERTAAVRQTNLGLGSSDRQRSGRVERPANEIAQQDDQRLRAHWPVGGEFGGGAGSGLNLFLDAKENDFGQRVLDGVAHAAPALRLNDCNLASTHEKKSSPSGVALAAQRGEM
jgi:hypothetical protein